VQLYKPDAPETNGVPSVLVERIDYSDESPWNGGADGFGPSLQRRVVAAYGNDATNWSAGLPSAGAVPFSGQPPVIAQQPPNVVGTEGVTTNLTVVVSGTPPFGYQWFFNGQSLGGEISSTLTLSNPPVNRSGLYSVVVFNGAGAVFSSNANVVIRPLPVISAQPQNQTPRPGSNVTISVTVNGTGAIRYQWRFNGTNIAGATNSSYSFTNAQLATHSGFYSVLVTDDVASVTSAAAPIIVFVPPVITTHPVAQTVVQGGTARFTITASPDHPMLPLNIRWLRNGQNWMSNAPLTLIITNCQSNGTFRAVATNLAGTTNSQPAALTVLPDADRDGLPDAWETNYFGNPTNASATADVDGDGMINGDEYIAGTNPNDASSVLKITLTATNTGLLNFVAQMNIAYAVLYRTNLSTAPWTVFSNINAQPQVRTIQFNAQNPPPQSERYYRVVTPPVP
jgi:hypothetical protein